MLNRVRYPRIRALRAEVISATAAVEDSVVGGAAVVIAPAIRGSV